MPSHDNVKAVNVATIFADIGTSVSDIDLELRKYMRIYNSYSPSLEKIRLGKQIVDLTASKVGFMTLIINDDKFLAIDLASMIPIFNELKLFIAELEEIADDLDDMEKVEAYSIIISSRTKIYDTKVFFYRFVDLSSLAGGLSSLNK